MMMLLFVAFNAFIVFYYLKMASPEANVTHNMNPIRQATSSGLLLNYSGVLLATALAVLAKS